MELHISISDKVYEKLVQFAEVRGITPQEGIRWLIGDFLAHTVPFIKPVGSIPPPPAPSGTSFAEAIRMLDEFTKLTFLKGDIKCPDCLKPITYDDFKARECSECGNKL